MAIYLVEIIKRNEFPKVFKNKIYDHLIYHF